MRLIDEIRTRFIPLSPQANYVPPAEWQAFDSWFRQSLDDIPVIIADNVDAFCLDRFGLGERATEITLADEFPNAAPPFPRMWIEWTPMAPQLRAMFERYAAMVTGVRTEYGWDIEIVGVLRPVGQRLALIGARNCIVHSSLLGLCESLNTCVLQVPGIEPAEKDIWDFFLSVPLMTMCFMNCRNVRVDWLPPPEPRQAKAFLKKRGIPMSRRIATIAITPMTKLIGAANAPGASERRKAAAHLCRGHFKHYGADNPLFGRTTGTFFWGAQLRNTSSTRDSEHAYKINTSGKGRK